MYILLDGDVVLADLLNPRFALLSPVRVTAPRRQRGRVDQVLNVPRCARHPHSRVVDVCR